MLEIIGHIILFTLMSIVVGLFAYSFKELITTRPFFKINAYGDKVWFNSKCQIHREDGPAVEYADGRKDWYKNDKRHRTDGPAVEWLDGYTLWYIDGKNITKEEFLDRYRLKKKDSNNNKDGK